MIDSSTAHRLKCEDREELNETIVLASSKACTLLGVVLEPSLFRKYCFITRPCSLLCRTFISFILRKEQNLVSGGWEDLSSRDEYNVLWLSQRAEEPLLPVGLSSWGWELVEAGLNKPLIIRDFYYLYWTASNFIESNYLSQKRTLLQWAFPRQVHPQAGQATVNPHLSLFWYPLLLVVLYR